MSDPGLVKLLNDSGLSEKEGLVYVSLLENGSATATKISKQTGLKRPTTYLILESLLKKGYANQIPERKVNLYMPGDPAILAAKLNTTAKYFLEMLPYLQTLQNKSGNRPKISYYDSEEAIWGVFRETSQYPDVRLITSYGRLFKYYPRETEEWLRNYEKRLYHLKNWRHLVSEISRIPEVEKRLIASGQDVRSLPDIDMHDIDLAIYQNKTSITFIAQNPFMVVIESNEFAHSMSNLFDFVWNLSKQTPSLV
ncbi:hypothetical protein HY415_02080 [Candidatus Kaiserbacteria bacterium]|nr:hypothetical protein [Candidatus Kaiserbacteria bacterium]